MAKKISEEEKLKEIVGIVEIAYHEEMERRKLLNEQSTSIVIVITLLATLIGIIFTSIVEGIDYTLRPFLIIAFFLNILALMASLICALIVQWRRKYRKFMNAMDFYNIVESNEDQYLDLEAFYKTKIKGYGDTSSIISSNNDKSAKLIIASHILIFISIFIIIQTIILFSICSLH